MLTANKYTDYITWCFMRFILYSFLLTFAMYSYNDLPKYALEFKQDLYRSAKLSGIELPQWIQNQIVHPIPFFTKIIYVVILFSSLAILGSKLFQFLSGLLMTVIVMIKYHPLTPSKLKPGEPYNALSEKYPWIDTCILEFFAILMFVNSMVNFKEEWLDALKDKEIIAINEEDYEEYKKKEEEKKQKGKKKRKVD
jgi:hypothetical protein